jgi:hypothetical protein
MSGHIIWSGQTQGRKWAFWQILYNSKIQGQCYWRIAPPSPQFLQVYFKGTSEETAQQRCTNIGGDSKLKVLTNLQKILYDHRKYVSVFKSALERLQNNTDMKIVIRPDKKPTMEHQGRLNP